MGDGYSYGSRLDTRREDLTLSHVEHDLRQRTPRRSGQRAAGRHIEDPLVTGTADHAVSDLRDDRARQMRTLLAIRDERTVCGAHEDARIMFCREGERPGVTDREIVSRREANPS